VNTWFLENLNKKRVIVRPFLYFLAFLNMAAGDLHTLQAALLLPPELLGEVCRHAIYHTPHPIPFSRPHEQK
jgi:hypothetical protein